MYLMVVMDWHSRKVLSWRLSDTVEAHFCVEVLEDVLLRHGRPEIFNTDQGAQDTSQGFTGLLKSHEIQLSMDGHRRGQDNILIERLWWSTKYQYLYLWYF